MNERLTKRCDDLFALKMKFNGESYVGSENYNKDFNVHNSEMLCDSEVEWNTKLEKLKLELAIRESK